MNNRNPFISGIFYGISGLISSLVIFYIGYVNLMSILIAFSLIGIILYSFLIGIFSLKCIAWQRVRRSEIEMKKFIDYMNRKIEEENNNPFMEFDNNEKR